MKNLFLFYFFLSFCLFGHAVENDYTIPTGTLVFYAAQPGEMAMDGINTADKNSPFTAALLENLKNPEDISFVLRKVRQKVLTATEQRQQPLTQDSYSSGSLVLAKINNGYSKKLIAQALVIGNSRYKEVSALRNSANDAKAISELLKKLNFTVTTSVDRNKSELISDISQFQENAKKSDITLFFFAGHGVQIDGVNYLLPVDVTANTASSVTEGSISLQAILKKFPGNTRLFLIDADSDNPFDSKHNR